MRLRGWPETVIRVAFGAIWAVDAWLKWQPGFRATYLPNLESVAAGEPRWLAPWFHFWLSLERPAPPMWAYLGATTETLLAIGVLLGVARVGIYVGGACYALLVWTTAGGFGGPYEPGATDIGPSVMYAVVFCALLILGAHGVDGGWNLDAVLLRRLPWWYRVALPLRQDAARSVPRDTVTSIFKLCWGHDHPTLAR
jgi:uncharacterized membrane protein YphA (DoxX/SURF4 family)